MTDRGRRGRDPQRRGCTGREVHAPTAEVAIRPPPRTQWLSRIGAGIEEGVVTYRTVQSRPRWSLVVALALEQRGLVRGDQLLAIGIPHSTISGWLEQGRIRVVHRGVYLVGAILPEGADRLAAVYACWPLAVLSHRSAAEEWKLIDERGSFVLQITAPGWRREGPSGVYVHRTALLPADEVAEIDGVPITSPARAVFDLASQAPDWEVAAAYEEGLIKGLFDRDAMIRMAMRHKGRRGIRKIRVLIDRDAPPSVTIKKAHLLLLELIRSSGLPHPRTEYEINGKAADIAWPEAKLVVEMDGGAFHNTIGRIERDKVRDAERAAVGWLTIRVTWNELTKRPGAVISRIARAYALRTAEPARS